MAIKTAQSLLDRYKSNYWIPADVPLTESQCWQHWDLEKSFRTELLASHPANRRAVFTRCYEQLYSELPWLTVRCHEPAPETLRPWVVLLGAPPQRVFEVGSGRGALIRYLAEHGYICRGSEITQERGERYVAAHENLTWAATDGVHLDNFEPAGAYDAVISDQVLEHLHPDDLVPHLRSALTLLRPGGRYLFRTPWFAAGPADVSKVFGASSVQGMHLKEYTYRELRAAALQAGFHRALAIFAVPGKLPWIGSRVRISPAYTLFAMLIDALPASVGCMMARARLMPNNVWMAAIKP